MPEISHIAHADQVAPACSVINPYALAEVVSGRRIDWAQVKQPAKLLESILETPYAELFDPKYGGPLYFGTEIDERGRVRQRPEPLLEVELRLDTDDLSTPLEADLSQIRRLGDLAQIRGFEELAGIEVRRVSYEGARHVALLLALPDENRLERLARLFPRDVLQRITLDPRFLGNEGWTPPGAQWQDVGNFFAEAAEYFDPIQGAVGDCYLIAALSSVAWARPQAIQHVTRATGPGQQNFTNRISFYKVDTTEIERHVEVTDAVLQGVGGGYLYCRSSEPGEVWPAVYEKAYAKFATNVNNDHPNITSIAGGDPVNATSRLVGGARTYHWTAQNTADALFDVVRGNSRGGRTFNPMTAWTYPSGDVAPNPVNYADANVVGNHAYSVLGWAQRGGVRYIVLRNPWGQHEVTAGALGGSITLHDVSWWRSVDLGVQDGTFAIPIDVFKSHFAGMGVVS